MKMLFRVDSDRLLQITVEDILTENTLLDSQDSVAWVRRPPSPAPRRPPLARRNPRYSGQ
jgi:hypothetical protein